MGLLQVTSSLWSSHSGGQTLPIYAQTKNQISSSDHDNGKVKQGEGKRVRGCFRWGGQKGSLIKFQLMQSKHFKEISWIYAQSLITRFFISFSVFCLRKNSPSQWKEELRKWAFKEAERPGQGSSEPNQKTGEAVQGPALPSFLKAHILKTLPNLDALFLSHPHARARVLTPSFLGVQQLLEKGLTGTHLHTHVSRHTDTLMNHTQTHQHAHTYRHIHAQT